MHYKTLRLIEPDRIITSFDELKRLQAFGQERPAGQRGVKYGMKPTVLDAIILMREAWSRVSPVTVANCWKKSQVC